MSNRRKLFFIVGMVSALGMVATWAAKRTDRGPDGFSCKCAAAAPGKDPVGGRGKLCGYNCECLVIQGGSTEKRNIEVRDTWTTAFSYEDWDRGSRICHGQYGFKPNMSSENWRIQVRFLPFWITHAGNVVYESKRIEFATGAFYEVDRTPEAREISDAIAGKLRD